MVTMQTLCLWQPSCSDHCVVLIQILLPTSPATNAPLTATARELGAAFGGVTAYVRSPAKGLWTAPDGRAEQDDVMMMEVVTERFDRSWWKDYASTLARRFQQQTIHVRAMPIELLDPAAS
jgi:hypothetical protein